MLSTTVSAPAFFATFATAARSASFVSWHQDSTYWGLSSPDVITAWVALSPSTIEAGAMRVIPGTHLRDQIPHQETFAPNNLLTRGQEIMVKVDEGQAVLAHEDQRSDP